MLKLNLKNINSYTILSLLFLIAGIGIYLYWGMTHDVWYDTGIYAITIVFVLPGIIGFVLSLMEKPED
ncbi:MAG: hypothetical protein JW771_00600 [Candidatus Thermoplasmatota archaeon]|nr:hypothetical protein [Candidatus Thermoplasmatota archaeon]